MVANRKVEPKPVFTSLEEEVEWYETHDSWDDDDVEVEFEVKKPLDKVIPVRLTDDKWSALRHEAIELGIGPTTLARMWILEKLRAVRAERVESAAPARPPRRGATSKRTGRAGASARSRAGKRKSA
jgi:hypothetical protein